MDDADSFRCSICRQSVSRKNFVDHYQRTDGGFDHSRCHTPEMEKLEKIFFGSGDTGTPQQVIRIAANIGHHITVDQLPAGHYQWVCACGLSGSSGDRSSRSVQMADGHRHLENIIVYGDV